MDRAPRYAGSLRREISQSEVGQQADHPDQGSQDTSSSYGYPARDGRQYEPAYGQGYGAGPSTSSEPGPSGYDGYGYNRAYVTPPMQPPEPWDRRPLGYDYGSSRDQGYYSAPTGYGPGGWGGAIPASAGLRREEDSGSSSGWYGPGHHSYGHGQRQGLGVGYEGQPVYGQGPGSGASASAAGGPRARSSERGRAGSVSGGRGSMARQGRASRNEENDGRAKYGDSDILPVDSDVQEAARAMASEKAKDSAGTSEWSYGPPLAIRDGMFSGKVLRFAIQCVQQPVHGRRKTDKDRRPLAPVPIVQIKIRECRQTENEDGWTEQDMDISSLEPSHLVCAAELSSSSSDLADSMLDPRPTEGPPDIRGLNLPHTGDRPSDGTPPRPILHPHHSYPGENPDTPDPLLPVQHVERGSPPRPLGMRHRASWIADGHWDSASTMISGQGQGQEPGSGESAPTPTQASFRVPSHPERLRRRQRVEEGEAETSGDDSDERSFKRVRAKVRRNLFGSLHVSAVRVPDMEGTLGLWFLFTDLCIRHEGTYSMRFRAFDLSVVTAMAPSVPDLGSCTSQTFRVYSPRQFPGLPKPTELSEHFVRQGFKLNTRKNERLVKTPSLSPPRAT